MQQDLREDDPGLLDILHPLAIRWKLAVGGVLTGMLIAAAVSFLMPKEYETNVLLNIGLSVDKPIEDPFTVTQIINSDSFQQSVATKVGLELPPKKLQKMIVANTDPLRNSPWVSIRIRATDPHRAVQLATSVGDAIIQRHAEFYYQKLQGFQDYKKDLLSRVDSFNREIDTLKVNLNAYRSSGRVDPSAEMLLQTRLSDKENQTIMFRRELRDLQTWMSKVHTRNTALVSKPVFPNKPTKPNLKLNVLLAGLGCTFIMVSFIFLMEQYKKRSPRF